MMLQALLKSLGVYENSARLRNDLQNLVDTQRDGLHRTSAAVMSLVIWGVVAAVLFTIVAIVAVIAVYISLRENFGAQVAIWSILAGVAVAALATAIAAWRSAVAIPALPPINVPELYREPEMPLREPVQAATEQGTASPSFSATPFAASGSLDQSLKDWMVKTAAQSAAALQPADTPVDTLLRAASPHVSAVAHSAIDDVAQQLENGSKGKIALILGSAVLAGVLISRTTK